MFTVRIVCVDAGTVGDTSAIATGTFDNDRVDADGDGTADVIDLDDENDGIQDIWQTSGMEDGGAVTHIELDSDADS